MARVTLLDGGMGRELKRMGAPFRQPEWSALALIEAPALVRRAHGAFLGAGAEIITTNSYALVPFHIGEALFIARAAELAGLSGALAREAVVAAGAPAGVAGSLPPLFGSYRPDLFDAARAPALLAPLVAGLAPHVDLWLGETLSSIVEAEAVRAAIGADRRPLWLSFTLADGAPNAAPALRSGEPALAVVGAAHRLGAEAVLFNCSQPEAMAPALRVVAGAAAGLRFGAYANAFPAVRPGASANSEVLALREDLDPEGYLAFVREWLALGADLVGGCCGIGPEHIARIRDVLTDRAPPATAST